MIPVVFRFKCALVLESGERDERKRCGVEISMSPYDKHMLISGMRSAGRTKSGSAMRSIADVLNCNAGLLYRSSTRHSPRTPFALPTSSLRRFTPNLPVCVVLSDTSVLVCVLFWALFLLLPGGKKEKGSKKNEIAYAQIFQLVWGQRLNLLCK